MVSRLSTGVDLLDQRLDGGIPAGSVVMLTAPPASQVELLLAAFATPRETLYLTLNRTEPLVAEGFRRTAIDTGDPTIQYVSEDSRIDHALDLVDEFPNESTIVVDPHIVLEREESDRVREFLDELHRHVIDTGSLAVLHCPADVNQPPLRATTANMVDAVFELTTDTAGAHIENRLAVPKFRGGRALTETLKLELTDQVRIDTSRDIA